MKHLQEGPQVALSKRYILFSNNNVYIHITETRSGWSIGSKICSITYGKTSQLCSKGKHLKYIAHYLETHGKLSNWN